MTLSRSLDRLASALAAVGVPLWEPPQSLDALEQLESAIEPLRLPAEVREFWRTVSTETLRVQPHPGFIGPDFALETWEDARDSFHEVQPVALVLVGYESHSCMSVELDMDGIQGGALFDWFISSPEGFTRRFNSLSEWLDYISAAIERGDYQREVNSESGDSLRLPAPFELSERGDAMPVAGPHPNHDSPNISRWPKHWNEATALHIH